VAIEAKDDSPVGPDCDAPKSRQSPLERVQPKTGKRHVVRFRRPIQTSKHNPDLIGMFGVYPAPVVVLIKPPQATMLETSDRAKPAI
jgi:hypothetical protein